MDMNVTVGNMKNLVTDKPAPLTVALIGGVTKDNIDSLFQLMDKNIMLVITTGQMNIVKEKFMRINRMLTHKRKQL